MTRSSPTAFVSTDPTDEALAFLAIEGLMARHQGILERVRHQHHSSLEMVRHYIQTRAATLLGFEG